MTQTNKNQEFDFPVDPHRKSKRTKIKNIPFEANSQASINDYSRRIVKKPFQEVQRYTAAEVKVNRNLHREKKSYISTNSVDHNVKMIPSPKIKTMNEHLLSAENYNNTEFTVEDKIYQTQEENRQFSNEKPNNEISVNISSMVNQAHKDLLEINKIGRKKKDKRKGNSNKIQKNNDKKEINCQKIIEERYQKEKHKQRNQSNLGAKTSISRRILRKNDYSLNSNKSRLPYGFRSNFDEKTLLATEDYRNYNSKDFSAFSTRQNNKKKELSKQNKSPKIRVVDKFKNIPPTNQDELKDFIENDNKRYNSRFCYKKDQDDLTNRLLSHSK